MNVFDQLIKFNIKPSVQRMAILEYLVQNNTHPTVEEIYHALSPSIPTLSKTTVYNTLKLFTEHGAVRMLTIDEKNACFDAIITPHSHFFCKNCGKIYDMGSDFPVPQDNAYTVDGHMITEVHYYYKGICKKCQN